MDAYQLEAMRYETNAKIIQIVIDSRLKLSNKKNRVDVCATVVVYPTKFFAQLALFDHVSTCGKHSCNTLTVLPESFWSKTIVLRLEDGSAKAPSRALELFSRVTRTWKYFTVEKEHNATPIFCGIFVQLTL